MKLNESTIKMYEKDLLSCGMIAKKFGVSRQSIWKYLRKHGIDTSKHLREVVCDQCEKIVKKVRRDVRNNKHHFCNPKCYAGYIQNPSYQENRQAQRIARNVMGAYFILQDAHVVHHKDGNNFNNELCNLWVFRNHADHMRYHRGGESEALIGETQEWKIVSKEQFSGAA